MKHNVSILSCHMDARTHVCMHPRMHAETTMSIPSCNMHARTNADTLLSNILYLSHHMHICQFCLQKHK